KSGKEGAPTYNLSYKTGIKNEATKGLKMMNATQRLDAWKEAIWNSFGSGEFGIGVIQSRDDILDFIRNNIGDDIDHWEALGRPDIDWKDEVANKDALTTDLNFSVAQG